MTELFIDFFPYFYAKDGMDSQQLLFWTTKPSQKQQLHCFCQ